MKRMNEIKAGVKEGRAGHGTFVQQVTRFQLACASHSPFVIAELVAFGR